MNPSSSGLRLLILSGSTLTNYSPSLPSANFKGPCTALWPSSVPPSPATGLTSHGPPLGEGHSLAPSRSGTIRVRGLFISF